MSARTARSVLLEILRALTGGPDVVRGDGATIIHWPPFWASARSALAGPLGLSPDAGWQEAKVAALRRLPGRPLRSEDFVLVLHSATNLIPLEELGGYVEPTPPKAMVRRRSKGAPHPSRGVQRGPSLFDFTFQPLAWLEGDEREHLEHQLADAGAETFFELRAMLRKGTWAVSMPAGAVAGALAPGESTLEMDAATFTALLDEHKASTGSSPIRRTRDVVAHHGVTFHKAAALAYLAQVAPLGLFFKAALRFVEEAERDPSLIRGTSRATAAVKPLSARPVVAGRRARGSNWNEFEDDVLRQEFGPRPDGSRPRLTDADWRRVEARLRGQRTRREIAKRLSHINGELRRSLERGGALSVTSAAEYQRRRLGQRERRVSAWRRPK